MWNNSLHCLFRTNYKHQKDAFFPRGWPWRVHIGPPPSPWRSWGLKSLEESNLLSPERMGPSPGATRPSKKDLKREQTQSKAGARTSTLGVLSGSVKEKTILPWYITENQQNPSPTAADPKTAQLVNTGLKSHTQSSLIPELFSRWHMTSHKQVYLDATTSWTFRWPWKQRLVLQRGLVTPYWHFFSFTQIFN